MALLKSHRVRVSGPDIEAVLREAADDIRELRDEGVLLSECSVEIEASTVVLAVMCNGWSETRTALDIRIEELA